MTEIGKKVLPFFIAILTFTIVSLVFFFPVLEGKEISQSDINQFKGVSKEIVDYRKEYDQEPYWTNRAFGGLPSYQVSAYYPHNYIKQVDYLLRFLPRPADYLFLYFLSFFVLLTVLKIDWKLSIIGAMAFGFSTYLIIIFIPGHNAKAHAIAYMPLVLAGILLVFKRNYLGGFILTALAMAFEITASHPQMTYYLLFMVLILGIVYLADSIKEKELPHFIKSVLILFSAVILAVGVNATSLLATKEYASNSTRSKSELTITPQGTPKEEITTGLSKEYITQYSIDLPETFNLLIPRFYGGGSRENVGKDSKTYDFLKDKIGRTQAKEFSENTPTYWGEQIIIEAPAYIGAVLIFLFVLGSFLVKGKVKKWLLAATVFSILLSWGRHFSILTDFFIDYIPLYNKFRAVSSIQVIAELAVPLLGIIGLNEFLKDTNNQEQKLKYLKYSLYGVGGIALLFTLFGTSLFDFESFRDASLEGQISGFSEALIADRKSIFFADSLRSLVLILLAAGILLAFLKNKINKNVTIIVFAALILFDLVAIDKRYVNEDSFISKTRQKTPFEATPIDKEILKDKSYYRVINLSNGVENVLNDGSTSYFHNSVGGYHAAKPRRYEELFEHHIYKGNFEILNMLNTKYIIFPDKDGNIRVQQNNEANGHAWFVDKIKFVNSADKEIRALDSLKTDQEVVIEAVFQEELKNYSFQKDSTATISLTNYKANEITYKSNVNSTQLAVFSEMYYKNGWNAYIDEEKTSIIRANYVLRALVVPEGEHKIEFKFEPTVIKKGNTITLVSYVLLVLIPIGWFFVEKRKKNESPQ
jgi:hypothetical protein